MVNVVTISEKDAYNDIVMLLELMRCCFAQSVARAVISTGELIDPAGPRLELAMFPLERAVRYRSLLVARVQSV